MEMADEVRTTVVSAIMTTQIEMVAESTPIRFVAELMMTKQIGGLPVTDDEGTVVGVVTAADLLGAVPRLSRPPGGASRGSGFYADLSPSVRLTPGLLDGLAEGTVRDYMSKLVVSVPVDATVGHAAQVMTDVGVHRVIVLDKFGNLAGLLTASDIVRHVAG